MLRWPLAMLMLLCGCGAGMDEEGPRCQAFIAVSPEAPIAPDTLVATATVTGDATGFTVHGWTALGPAGETLDVLPRDPDSRAVDIAAAEPGEYAIALAVTRGGTTCQSDQVFVQVLPPTLATHRLRVSYAPAPPSEVPPQDEPALVSVYAGVDVSLPPTTLEVGRAFAASLDGPAADLAAQLELEPLGGGAPMTVFAGTDGTYQGRIAGEGPWWVRVTPYDMAIAPDELVPVDFAQLDQGLSLTAGVPITGQVLDAAGVPVAGALVTVAADDRAATYGLTDATGGFALRARDGDLTVTVTPPGPAPALVARMLEPGALTVRLADVAFHPLDLEARRSDGSILAGARLTVRLVSPLAGSIQRAGGAPVDAPAWWQRSVVAGADGRAQLDVPAGQLVVDVSPPADAPGDERLATGQPFTVAGPTSQALRTAHVTLLTILAVEPDGVTPVPGVQLELRELDGPGLPVERGRTGVDGGARFAVAPSRRFELTGRAPRGVALATTRKTIELDAGATQSLSLRLAPGRLVRGRVLSPAGVGLAGVAVTIECLSCPPDASGQAVREAAITGPGGHWEIVVDDPGSL
jgi:hypothetical protein